LPPGAGGPRKVRAQLLLYPFRHRHESSLHQEIAIALDLRKSFDHIPAGQPVVRHYPGPLTLITQRDSRLGARPNDVDMRRAMIV
jgi:hypothetical protein